MRCTSLNGLLLSPDQLQRRQFLKTAAVVAAGVSTGNAPLPTVAAQNHDEQLSAPRCRVTKSPMSEVAGKVAFITGGSSGIGLGIARAFAEAGMKVVICYRTAVHAETAMKSFKNPEGRVHAIKVDVTDRLGMDRAAAEAVRIFGKIHVLVCNAGVVGVAPLERTTYDDWDWMMGVNTNGVFNSIHSVLPYIRSNGDGGHVIATSSAFGLVAAAGVACYAASKFAVVGMMECLRAELAGSDIGVSIYCPGMVTSSISSANRNRPGNLPATGFDQRALDQAGKVTPAMDSLEAGRLVLRGMRNNDLYILTHADFSEIIRHRSDALSASLPEDVHSTRVRDVPSKNIYRIERDRKLCLL
jgi:NAD(P)-dependent dehydrogenase (short-subunit alcohol dehydrogenase family)